LEKGKVHPEEVVGVKKIYNKLEALNDEVRKGAEVCFPMLPWLCGKNTRVFQCSLYCLCVWQAVG